MQTKDPIVNRLPLKAMTPRLRALVKEHEIAVAVSDRASMQAFFTPEGTVRPDDPPVLIAPTKWSARAQEEMACMLEGYFHGVNVERMRAEEAQSLACA
ncbi:MAG TPA: hypothetical protein VFF76_04560 [Holophagaceae bacterium]|jgi:hypothetical protein|nr:hypothetical protein [Holophagaceae bacterium]